MSPYNRPFLICGLPRSRTAWLASFFEVVHEPSIDWSSYDDACQFYQRGGASSDSMQTVLASRLLFDVPGIHVFVILRNRLNVERSARKLLGLEQFGSTLDAISLAIEALTFWDNVTFIPFESLGVASLQQMWQTVSSEEFPQDRYDDLADINIQIDLAAHRSRVEQNIVGIRNLYSSIQDGHSKWQLL
jgi:hypothetical protein